MHLDTSTATGKLMLNVLCSVADFERSMMLMGRRRPRTSTKFAHRRRCEKRTWSVALQAVAKAITIVDTTPFVRLVDELGNCRQQSKKRYFRCQRTTRLPGEAISDLEGKCHKLLSPRRRQKPPSRFRAHSRRPYDAASSRCDGALDPLTRTPARQCPDAAQCQPTTCSVRPPR